MKRGEVWTASGGDYAGKPRPVFILQADAFPFLTSITICPFTSDGENLEIFRIGITPGQRNGLNVLSYVMADKITTLPRSKLGRQIGILDIDDVRRVERAVMVFLGL
jgi:mRNA interferase MazF